MRRNIFTFLFWLIFLTIFVIVYLYVSRWFRLLSVILISALFTYLMNVRKRYLNNPQGSFKCHLELHDIESENIDYIDKTIQCNKDERYIVKRNKVKIWCKRKYCDFKDWYITCKYEKK